MLLQKFLTGVYEVGPKGCHNVYTLTQYYIRCDQKSCILRETFGETLFSSYFVVINIALLCFWFLMHY